MIGPDPIAALRAATGPQHEILDTGLPLAQSDAGLPAYVAHLQMLDGWLRPIQVWLAHFADGPQQPGLLPAVDRLALIESDLRLAGAGAGSATDSAPWPPHASAAYRWGVAYVVEGSQLGGAVLYKRLAERLAPHPLAYLKPGEEGPGPRWRVFMAALREQVQSEHDIRDACAGAQAAFARILALGQPAEL